MSHVMINPHFKAQPVRAFALMIFSGLLSPDAIGANRPYMPCSCAVRHACACADLHDGRRHLVTRQRKCASNQHVATCEHTFSAFWLCAIAANVLSAECVMCAPALQFYAPGHSYVFRKHGAHRGCNCLGLSDESLFTTVIRASPLENTLLSALSSR